MNDYDYHVQGKEPDLDFKQAMMTCQRSALNTEDFSCIKLVYGEPGKLCMHTYTSSICTCTYMGPI